MSFGYRDLVVYVSGRIRGKTTTEEYENCRAAVKLANSLVEKGFSVVCTHVSYPLMREVGARHEPWLESDCAVVRACDAVLLVGEDLSPGMQLEVDTATAAQVPVFSSVEGLTSYADGLMEAEARRANG
jgi:hypothetical protein